MSAVVRPLRRAGGLPPLFLVAAPGVNALGYVALGRSLDPRESPFAVQAPHGTPAQRRDYEPEEIAALADGYLAAVRARQAEGPYFFAGMCDGAHIAFEMARKLEAVGQKVGLLAVLDTWPVENSSRHALVVLESLRKRWKGLSNRQRIAWMKRWIQASWHRFLSSLSARANKASGPSLSARANKASGPSLGGRERWRARVWPGPGFVPPVYGGRITVIRARRQAYWRLRDEALGWRARSREQVVVHVVPGRHEVLLRRPAVDAVARALEQALEEARDRVGIPPARLEMRRLS